MTSQRKRPSFTGDEREQLVGWLDLQRAIVHMKCEGLSDADAHRVVVESSPLMTAAGLVAHLRWVEHTWFEVLFSDASAADNPSFDDSVEDKDMRVEGVPLKELLDDYEKACARSNEVVAQHDLGDVGRNTAYAAGQASLRWIMLHMVEETARHVGHLDLIREALDGVKGYY